MATVYKENDLSKISSKKIFFDANILIYLFWPTNYRAEKDYSRLFKKMLDLKCEKVINYIVLSEVVNRVIKTEQKKYEEENFKKFRDSTIGQEVQQQIYSEINRKILKNFTVKGKAFTKEDLNSFLQLDSLDFSDKALVKICQENDYILLTHDKDFKESQIDILTANKNYFS